MTLAPRDANDDARRWAMSHRWTRRPFLVLAISALFINPARAHDVELTKVSVTFTTRDTYQIDFHYDVNAWLLGVRPEHLTPAEIARLTAMPVEASDKRMVDLREHILRNLRIRFDEVNVTPAMTIIDNPDRPTSQPAHGSTLLRIVRLTGNVSPGAKSFDFWASRSFGNIALMIAREDGTHYAQQLLERAERSRPYALHGGPVDAGAFQITRQYLWLGFQHILPKGLDHILFVLGLFLLSTKLSPLMWQVTAFTLAHSVSLALSTYGVITLSPRIVEPLIALSIAAVAVENILTSKLQPWRPVVVFLFGLLHGLGFAGVLSELGLPRGQFATALVSFNIGVELGQLAVIALALTTVGWFRSQVWYRARIVIPCSILIGTTGLFWTVERIMVFEKVGNSLDKGAITSYIMSDGWGIRRGGRAVGYRAFEFQRRKPQAASRKPQAARPHCAPAFPHSNTRPLRPLAPPTRI